jgi:choline-sulfatase
VLYGAYSGGSKPGIRCVKQGPWKLIRYEAPDRAVSRVQLFNLDTNPDELLKDHHDPRLRAILGRELLDQQQDLSGDPRFSSQLDRMQALLVQQMQAWDDPHSQDGLSELPEP